MDSVIQDHVLQHSEEYEQPRIYSYDCDQNISNSVTMTSLFTSFLGFIKKKKKKTFQNIYLFSEVFSPREDLQSCHSAMNFVLIRFISNFFSSDLSGRAHQPVSIKQHPPSTINLAINLIINLIINSPSPPRLMYAYQVKFKAQRSGIVF